MSKLERQQKEATRGSQQCTGNKTQTHSVPFFFFSLFFCFQTQKVRAKPNRLPGNIKTRDQRHHTTLTAKPLKYWLSCGASSWNFHQGWNINWILTLLYVCKCVLYSGNSIAEDNNHTKRICSPVVTKVRQEHGKASVKRWEGLREDHAHGPLGQACSPKRWHWGLMKRPDKRWNTRGCQRTPHLSWDKQGPVSPTALTLRWPRMLREWRTVRGQRWRGRGLRLLIRESDNKTCQREVAAQPGQLWQRKQHHGCKRVSRNSRFEQQNSHDLRGHRDGQLHCFNLHQNQRNGSPQPQVIRPWDAMACLLRGTTFCNLMIGTGKS